MGYAGYAVFFAAVIAAIDPEGFGRWLGVIVVAFRNQVGG
jgi:hypothetical protein